MKKIRKKLTYGPMTCLTSFGPVIVVVATHDPEVVELCDRVVRLVDGRPVELTPDEVGDTVA